MMYRVMPTLSSPHQASTAIGHLSASKVAFVSWVSAADISVDGDASVAAASLSVHLRNTTAGQYEVPLPSPPFHSIVGPVALYTFHT